MTLKKKKIAIITTSRSDWVSLAPLAEALDQSLEFDLILMAGGYHFVKELGYSFKQIQNQGFKRIIRISNNSANYKNMFIFSNGIQKQIIKVLQKHKPDFVIITGDRLEQLECAIAAKSINCKLVHLCGGDLSGNLDNLFRFAISQLADYHFVKTKESRARLIERGINRSKIKIVGLPAFDFIKALETELKEDCLKARFGLNAYEYILVLFNPEDYDDKTSFSEMKTILNQLSSIPKKKLIIYPNGDAGSAGIIKAIKLICRNTQEYVYYKNVSPQDFILLEKFAALMVGNSSSGLWEAPIFGTPVVNLGSRQDKRERLFGVIDLKELKNIQKTANEFINVPLSKRVKIARKSRRYVKFGQSSKLVCRYLRNIKEKEKIC